MFCPSCGQERLNKEIRFCSRCGFSFEIVTQLLDHGGYLPQLEEIKKQQNSRLNRSNGLKFALFWFLALALFFAPVAEALGINRLPELFAALGVCGGLLLLVFSFLFLKKAPRSRDDEQLNPIRKMREPNALGAGNKNALPPQQSVPASAYVPPMDSGKQLDTFDLSRPGSVTEGTTKLLEKDE